MESQWLKVIYQNFKCLSFKEVQTAERKFSEILMCKVAELFKLCQNFMPMCQEAQMLKRNISEFSNYM